MAKIETDLVIKVTADTTEVRVLLAKLAREFAAALKDSFFEGYKAGESEFDTSPEMEWNQSEAKKRYDELLSE